MSRRKTIGMVGARGHVGTELIALITHHPALELTFVASREREGQRVSQHSDTYAGTLRYQFPDPSTVAAKALDVVILALPNGKATTYIQAIDATAPGTLVVDLSADYRFNQDWYYGLPEITRSHWQGQKRISNPGCYATAIALSIRPLKDLLVAPPVCFGVSGYSGAGTTPSDKNDPHKLRDNLIPYALTHHGHEKEAGFQLGLPVEFIPHVGSHFRGLMVTSNLYLGQPLKREAVMERFQRTYDGEPLVQIMDEVPWVSHIAHKHHARIGGFGLSTDHKRVVVVAVLDNLLKGAATQAMQNINRALGMDEYTGIPIHPTGR